MLTINLNPKFDNNQGGVTLSGTVSSPTATVRWRWFDEETFQSTYVRQEGINWSIDFRFASNIDSIIIQASEGIELSNNISVDLSTQASTTIDASFKFNEFDEVALINGIERIPAEDNEDLRSRVHDVFLNPGNATKRGLTNGIERELGLPHLNPFFFISVRWSPLTNSAYKTAYVNFSHNEVSVQLKSYVKFTELIDLDPVTFKFTTIEEVGSEFPDDNNVIQILNGDKTLPSHLWNYEGDSVFKLDGNHPDIDTTKNLTITYPYKKSFKYKTVNESTNETSVASVADVRQWIREVETVVDENSQTQPLINWNDGFFQAIDFLPEGETAEVRVSLEDGVNNTPSTGYIQVTNDPDQEYYRYVTPYVAKGFFTASQILDTNQLELDHTPVQVDGTWVVMNEFHDANFREFLETNDGQNSNKNLLKYATELREAVRMGMDNTLVNHDYWGSDAPEIIGDNFLPSRYDGGIQPFKSLSSGGAIVDLSLNARKFYAKQIAMGVGV